MSSVLSLVGREHSLLDCELDIREAELKEMVSSSSFLVLGGAGSIGAAVVKEIFQRDPRKLYVVDISENNLVEQVRDLRSTFGYITGEFKTFALDIGSVEYEAMMRCYGGYDYVLNLSALKHVRSEKDPFTLMRMIDVNIFNTERAAVQALRGGAKKYFCVSTDKAANPVNMMGASKRIMEMYLMRSSDRLPVSTARFANVAFSDGSLLHSFNQRLLKGQPIVAPNDVRRYFVTAKESGQLCLMSCLLGDNRDIFFPKPSEQLDLTTFSEVAERYLRLRGYEPYLCSSEAEARELVKTLPSRGKWPCLFAASDTTGEKSFEEFYTDDEVVDITRFQSIGIVKNSVDYDAEKLSMFEREIGALKASGCWDKGQIVALFHELLPGFVHKETGRYLDDKM